MSQSNNFSSRTGQPRLHVIAAAAALLGLTACASIEPAALTRDELRPATEADAKSIRAGVDPITGSLSLDEAIARALKYNLDRRSRMMEEALALNQLDVSKQDMLPRLLAQAGYNWRNNDRISQSRDSNTGDLSPSRFISADRAHDTRGLEFTWSSLDLGLGYYGSRQSADRVLIASEKRRRAMHVLMQDVRNAFWRAAAAQRLQREVGEAIATAELALKDSRTAEAERVRNPLDALRYQRQLLENLRLLEGISHELASAQTELVSLINAPLGQRITLALTEESSLADAALKLPVEALEEATLAHNADLREAHYNSRIARQEVRRTMARLWPNLSFNAGLQYDSDSYLVNRDWQEAGLRLSFNLFNLFTGKSQIQLAEAGVALSDQRRLAMQMSVLTQMHLARIALVNAQSQFSRADMIFGVDSKIGEMVKSRESAQAMSKLEVVSNATTGILSVLRRYQALSQVQVAESRLIATLGLEPQIGSVGEMSLAQLTAQLRGQSNPWSALANAKKP